VPPLCVGARERASARAPLYWLSWEDEVVALPAQPRLHELRLRAWPGGEQRLLARGQPHADWIEWLG